LSLVAITGCYSSKDSTKDSDTESPEIVDIAHESDCTDPVCDIFPQCGCPEGMMCTYLVGRGRACVSAGTKREGEDCEPDECSPGLICYNDLCHRACNADEDCINSNYCYITLPGDSLKLCNIRCNFVTLDGCPGGHRCDFLRPSGYDDIVTECYSSSGDGIYGDPCDVEEGDNYICAQECACAPGYACAFYFSVGGQCRDICFQIGERDPNCEPDRPCCSGVEYHEIDGIQYRLCASAGPSGDCI
jgi:hypothetical protein